MTHGFINNNYNYIREIENKINLFNEYEMNPKVHDFNAYYQEFFNQMVDYLIENKFKHSEKLKSITFTNLTISEQEEINYQYFYVECF